MEVSETSLHLKPHKWRGGFILPLLPIDLPSCMFTLLFLVAFSFKISALRVYRPVHLAKPRLWNVARAGSPASGFQ